MQIFKQEQDGMLTLTLEGRLDRTTAPELEQALNVPLEELVLDFEKVEYISSAGLRVLLAAQRRLTGGRRVVIRNANEFVRDVFAMTGFMDILDVQ